jgi:protein O-mannosyl-transferase
MGRNGLLMVLALVVMTLFAYWPAIHEGGFIWDDDDYVTANKTLRDMSGLKDIWFSPKATPQYYPLVHSGFWIEYQLWGLHPTGYHITNVLLHAFAALLLWRLLSSLTVPGAWLAAALFALHPVHVESVAWVTERKNVLSAVFYLGAALVYLKWADTKATGGRRPRAYFGALLLFICALLSKTVTASLPAALILVMWWKDGRDNNFGAVLAK